MRRKVLLVAMNYAPERSGTAPYTMAWARHMAQTDDVVVLAGAPHYPEWRIHDGYGGWREVADEAGVRVVRLRHVVPRTPSMGARVLHETSFAARVLTQRVGRPDVVLAVSPPLFGAGAAATLARRLGVPFGLVVQDVYSRGVRELGEVGNPGVGAIEALERRVVRAADGILTIHSQFRETVTGLGADPARVTIVGNWAQLPAPSRPRAEVRAQHGWGDELVALHAGNMGAKQGLETVVDAAGAAASAGLALRYVLMGDGNQRPGLEARGAGVAALQFLPPTAPQDYADLLNAADVLVVCEKPGVAAMSLPSKLTSYCAAGKPILAATGTDGATAAAMRASGAGLVVPPGRPDQLNQAALSIGADPDRAREWGERGQQHALDTQGMAAAMKGYDEWLDGLLGAARTTSSKPASALSATASGGA